MKSDEIVRKLEIRNGDIVLISRELSPEEAMYLREEWNKIGLDGCLIMYGVEKEDIVTLDEDTMRKYGWVREKH